MRRIRYAVAASLDGYIAGPKGEAEWVILDPEIDFAKMFKEFDTVFLGRHSFEAMARAGNRAMPGVWLSLAAAIALSAVLIVTARASSMTNLSATQIATGDVQ